MQEKHLFEYAVIRVIPRVERQEFLNVGVILYCPSLKFLETKHEVNVDRLCLFSDKLDLEELEEHLYSFTLICGGGKDAGPIGQLPVADRFRWLTAYRSTIVQTSCVHLGLCEDPHKTLLRLYDQLVK